MQAAGNWQPLLEGCPAKIYVGFATLGGALSAQLAAQGVELGCAALEGEAGLFASHYGGNYVREALIEGLGREFYVLDLRFKPWPVTGAAHPFIQAALELRDEHHLVPSEIARVTIIGGSRLSHHCEPLAERRHPASAAAAADSIFFAVAKALANGRVCLADFSDDGLFQREALDLAERMDYATDSALGEAGIVELETAAGRHLTSRVDMASGHPSKPLTQQQLVEKFEDCARYARQPLGRPKIEQLIDQVQHLEQLDDISVLASLASGGE